MSQLDLFGGPPPIEPPPYPADLTALGAALPPDLHLATCSWTYPGWAGHLYAGRPTESALVERGLSTFARHPLLRGVSLDRGLYAPLSASVLAGFAEQVPRHFRFWIKAHEHITLARFPDLQRHGEHRDQPNPRWLDAAYATDAFVGPALAGLGARAGPLLFQLSAQHASELPPPAFAERLHRFLDALPKGPLYAVELRDSRLFLPIYAEALAAAGAVHCYTVHPAMPDLDIQRLRLPAVHLPALVLRWSLAPDHTYVTADRTFAPFDRLKRPHPTHRKLIATLCRQAAARGQPIHIAVSNHAEGCAPLSIVELARVLVEAPTPTSAIA